MPETQFNAKELTNLARARAAFSSFLTVHFNVLPDEEFVERMRSEAVLSMLKALPGDESNHPDIAAGAARMSAFLAATGMDTPTELSQKLGIERTRVYRGLSPAVSPPPPYEMVWSQTWHEVTLLVELAGIYRAKGLGPATEGFDRLDYIGTELEYLHTLATREGEAWEAGEDAAAAELLQDQARFFSEHMRQWVPSFVDKALEYVETDFYHGHLLMLRGFIAEQAEIFTSISAVPAA